MQSGRKARAVVLTAALSAAALLDSTLPLLHAGQAVEPAPAEGSARAADLDATASWEDFVTLEVREDELVLTNVSDRAIVAWSVRQVTRITEGNEGYGGVAEDAFGYAVKPDGYDDLLLPGESVNLERPPDPWIRPDLKGPEYLVYYDVGALVFENAEWVGVPEVVDRIFDYRLKVARDALTALQILDSPDPNLDGLPSAYQNTLHRFTSRTDGVRAILEEAREDYEAAVANLRQEDLAKLPSPEEKQR